MVPAPVSEPIWDLVKQLYSGVVFGRDSTPATASSLALASPDRVERTDPVAVAGVSASRQIGPFSSVTTRSGAP